MDNDPRKRFYQVEKKNWLDRNINYLASTFAAYCVRKNKHINLKLPDSMFVQIMSY